MPPNKASNLAVSSRLLMYVFISIHNSSFGLQYSLQLVCILTVKTQNFLLIIFCFILLSSLIRTTYVVYFVFQFWIIFNYRLNTNFDSICTFISIFCQCGLLGDSCIESTCKGNRFTLIFFILFYFGNYIFVVLLLACGYGIRLQK